MERFWFCLFLFLPSCFQPAAEPPEVFLEDAIVQLDIRGPTSSFSCSGVLIGPSVVATAAHCLTGSHRAQSVDVWPGGDSLRSVSADSWEVETCYVEFGDDLKVQRCDLAVLFLREPLGQETGWFEPRTPSEFLEYRVSGWPAGASEPTVDTGTLRLGSGVLYTQMVVKKGMSGGPIFRGDKVVGIVTWISHGHNIGLPFTLERLRYFQECNFRKSFCS